MDTLRSSSKVRLWFPRDDGTSVCREIAGGVVGLERHRSPDRLYQQLRMDGIDVEELRSLVRHAMTSCPEIEKVGVTYSGNEYTILVVARPLNDRELVDLRWRLDGFYEWFPGGAASISIFGPAQRVSVLFDEALVVYNHERSAA